VAVKACSPRTSFERTYTRMRARTHTHTHARSTQHTHTQQQQQRQRIDTHAHSARPLATPFNPYLRCPSSQLATNGDPDPADHNQILNTYQHQASPQAHGTARTWASSWHRMLLVCRSPVRLRTMPCSRATCSEGVAEDVGVCAPTRCAIAAAVVGVYGAAAPCCCKAAAAAPSRGRAAAGVAVGHVPATSTSTGSGAQHRVQRSSRLCAAQKSVLHRARRHMPRAQALA
jgi:hypothetical protein